jgi:internalin A
LTDDGISCPGEFRLDGLQRLHEAGKATIPCMQCVKDYEISALLTGFAVSDAQLSAELGQMNAMLTDISDGTEGIQGRVTDIAEAVRRVQHAISIEVTDCPRLFSLRADRAWPDQDTMPRQENYRLTLWCEHPGYWHPWERASYELHPPNRWFPQVRPYVLLVFQTLQLIVPLAGPAGNTSFTAELLDQARSHLQEMSILLADQSSHLTSRIMDSDHGKPGKQLTPSEGQALRAIRVALFENDLSRAFGGMRRVQDASGDFLWVCPTHYPEYDPGLPEVPF